MSASSGTNYKHMEKSSFEPWPEEVKATSIFSYEYVTAY